MCQRGKEIVLRSHVHILNGDSIAALYDAITSDVFYVTGRAATWLQAYLTATDWTSWLVGLEPNERRTAAKLFSRLYQQRLMVLKEDAGEDRLGRFRDSLGPLPPRVLDIIPTFACNLSCTYCYQQEANRRGSRWFEHFLDVDTAVSIVRAFLEGLSPSSAPGHRPAELVFIGGEPLLHPELLETVIPFVRGHEKGRHDALEIVLVTNATLVDDHLASLFARHQVFVVVSIDGRPTTHDRARIALNGEGSSAETLAGYRTLVRQGCRVGVALTVAEHNVDTFVEEAEWVLDYLRPQDLCSNSCLHRILGSSRPTRVAPERFSRQLARLFEIRFTKGSVPLQLMRRFEPLLRRKPVLHYCVACTEKLVVAPDGRVCQCEGFAFLGAGLTRWPGDARAMQRARHQWASFSPVVIPECCGCPWLLSCGGGCRYDALVSVGSQRIDSYRCAQDSWMNHWFVLDFLPHQLSVVLDDSAQVRRLRDDERERIWEKAAREASNLAWR